MDDPCALRSSIFRVCISRRVSDLGIRHRPRNRLTVIGQNSRVPGCQESARMSTPMPVLSVNLHYRFDFCLPFLSSFYAFLARVTFLWSFFLFFLLPFSFCHRQRRLIPLSFLDQITIVLAIFRHGLFLVDG